MDEPDTPSCHSSGPPPRDFSQTREATSNPNGFGIYIIFLQHYYEYDTDGNFWIVLN